MHLNYCVLTVWKVLADIEISFSVPVRVVPGQMLSIYAGDNCSLVSIFDIPTSGLTLSDGDQKVRVPFPSGESSLVYNERYSLCIPGSAVEDLSGNSLSSDLRIGFTTRLSPPVFDLTSGAPPSTVVVDILANDVSEAPSNVMGSPFSFRSPSSDYDNLAWKMRKTRAPCMSAASSDEGTCGAITPADHLAMPTYAELLSMPDGTTSFSNSNIGIYTFYTWQEGDTDPSARKSDTTKLILVLTARDRIVVEEREKFDPISEEIEMSSSSLIISSDAESKYNMEYSYNDAGGYTVAWADINGVLGVNGIAYMSREEGAGDFSTRCFFVPAAVFFPEGASTLTITVRVEIENNATGDSYFKDRDSIVTNNQELDIQLLPYRRPSQRASALSIFSSSRGSFF